MASDYADLLRGRRRERSGRREAELHKVRLSKPVRDFIAKKNVRPWSPTPGIEDVVGYERGPRRAALRSTFVSTLCQLRGGDSSPVLLFQGPPGVGKSYMAAAIARSVGMEMHVLRKNEIVSSYYGKSESNFTKYLLARAASFRATGVHQMVIIDEAESVFMVRDEEHERSPLVGVFNEFVNGARHPEIGNSIVFVLCINRPELVEAGVMSRARVMTFPPPGQEEAERLLIYHSVAKGLSVDRCVDFAQLARRVTAMGLTHRDVTHVVSSAQANALMRHSDGEEGFDAKSLMALVDGGGERRPISHDDFLRALEEVAAARPDRAGRAMGDQPQYA